MYCTDIHLPEDKNDLLLCVSFVQAAICNIIRMYQQVRVFYFTIAYDYMCYYVHKN